jgi:hypothetical protein
MSDNTTTTAAVDEVREAKRKSVTLTAGAGDKAMRLTILARRTGSGGETTVTTVDAKKKATRGMTQKFDSFELAVEALGKLVKDATSKGWKRTERLGGFKAKPDAFSTMPTAPKGGAK